MTSANYHDSRKAKVMLTASRIVVYAILIFLSVLCLFSFYMLFINATRSNADLQGGFQLLFPGVKQGQILLCGVVPAEKRLFRQVFQSDRLL